MSKMTLKGRTCLALIGHVRSRKFWRSNFRNLWIIPWFSIKICKEVLYHPRDFFTKGINLH
jgi:GT2 family glycosyltransferase